jgi:hypothetical protein
MVLTANGLSARRDYLPFVGMICRLRCRSAQDIVLKHSSCHKYAA